MNDTQEDKIANFGSKPKIKELILELRQCSPWSANSWNRISTNEDIRFCRWANKNPDGKKHDLQDTPAFPFDGASDCEVKMADEIINENVAVLVSAFWRSLVRQNMAGSEEGAYAVRLAEYIINERQYHSFLREVILSAQYRETVGWTMLHPTWEREIALENQEITLEQLIAIADQLASQNMNSAFSQLPALIIDPAMDDTTVNLIKEIYSIHVRGQLQELGENVELPPLRTSTATRAIKELRETGKAKVPMPYLCKNQPAIVALKPWDEVFIPSDCTDIQRARVIFRRCWFTEVELRSNIIVKQWNKKWVEEALKHKGKYSNWSQTSSSNTDPPTALSTAMVSTSTGMTETFSQNNQLIEVVYACYKSLDEDGVPGIYYTVFHPLIGSDPMNENKELFAESGLLEYAKGKYPYVAGQRESWSRIIISSRGVPEVVNSEQRQSKVQQDAVVDWTSLGVLPPINVPKGTMASKFTFAPAFKNEVTAGREPTFMEIPTKGTPVSFEVLELLEKRNNNYFGRMSEDVPPARSQMIQQQLINPFLIMWSEGVQQMILLCQQYMPDAEFAKATGAPKGWLDQNRGRQGLLSTELQFDVRELDPDYMMAQMDAINKTVIPADVAGIIDRAKYTRFQLRAINPILARELVSDQGEASQKLFERVQQDIALMFLGNEPQYVQMDPTAPTKLKYAQQVVGSNPNYQQALQNREGRFAQLMEKWVMNLQFSMTQEQNKQVGRIGVTPEMEMNQ